MKKKNETYLGIGLIAFLLFGSFKLFGKGNTLQGVVKSQDDLKTFLRKAQAEGVADAKADLKLVIPPGARVLYKKVEKIIAPGVNKEVTNKTEYKLFGQGAARAISYVKANAKGEIVAIYKLSALTQLVTKSGTVDGKEVLIESFALNPDQTKFLQNG